MLPTRYKWERTPLRAVADGVVSFAGTGQPFSCPTLEGRTVSGQVVEIEHMAPPSITSITGERLRSLYHHLSRIDVRTGERVQAGQQVTLSGNTGCSI